MALEQLQEQIRSCSKCPLREGATQPVIGWGNPNAKYMLIGEAPGRTEDRDGIPFTGLAGKRLDRLLELAKIDPNDCFFTNVIRCRPPANRDPRKAEMRSCLKFLQDEIKLIKPEYIITLGAIPLGLFSSYGIRSMHGCMFEYEIPDD